MKDERSNSYLRPLDLSRRLAGAPGARPLAGGPLWFLLCEELRRDDAGFGQGRLRSLRELAEEDATDLLERLSRPRPDFAGLPMDRPRIMGIVNVTPDSFSDGGDRFDAGRAVADGLAMAAAGAALVDVGGESTRPGAAPVPEDEELRRVLPVIKGLARQGLRVSIDTRHARVMAEALAAGAAVINDVTALAGEDDSLRIAAEAGIPVVLMHMRGQPRTMQQAPAYRDAALDVYDYLAARVAACQAAGIDPGRIALDPGIGFGKSLSHNLRILDLLALYHGLGCPLLLGVSRKSFIARLAGEHPPKDRTAGSLAAALAGLRRGVQIFRVHDVAETAQAFAIWQAIEGGETPDDAVTSVTPKAVGQG